MALFNAIHHVAIIASNYEVSKAFYAETLGFEIIKETYRDERDSWKLDLRVNEQTQIELFSFPTPPKRVSGPEAAGLRHLAFHVDDVDDVRKSLKEKNIAMEEVRIDPITKKRFFFFADPDGLPLEVYER